MTYSASLRPDKLPPKRFRTYEIKWLIKTCAKAVNANKLLESNTANSQSNCEVSSWLHSKHAIVEVRIDAHIRLETLFSAYVIKRNSTPHIESQAVIQIMREQFIFTLKTNKGTTDGLSRIKQLFRLQYLPTTTIGSWLLVVFLVVEAAFITLIE
ncbi:hypothetical protein Tco_0764928 [Tanacetum coccineum]